MMLPIAFVSAFLNNTPVVAIMIPIILTWCRKTGIAPGHLFMPLSFASILGGTVTLIGTSTNLVVAGLQRERFPDEPAFGIFDLSPFGVPVALAGLIYVVLFGPKLLPGVPKGTPVQRCAPARRASARQRAPARAFRTDGSELPPMCVWVRVADGTAHAGRGERRSWPMRSSSACKSCLAPSQPARRCKRQACVALTACTSPQSNGRPL